MGRKKKLGLEDKLHSLEKKRVDYSKVVEACAATDSLRKRHRPWRNKVRKKAAKEANKKRREGGGGEIDADGKVDSSLFRYINEQLYTMSGAEALEFFQRDPKAFELYHKGYQKQAKKWPYNPVDEIIRWIRSLKLNDLVIVDLGCGNATIAKTLSDIATVYSYDLVAVNDFVTRCDMSKVPLCSESVNIAVFCLSLMGTNLIDYLEEAHRLLKKGGFLKIAEVASRFISVNRFVQAVTEMGFDMTGKATRGGGYFVILEFIKTSEMMVQKRPTGLKLKPCLYKKR
uniref:Ribosomal RNA-processing protein 8 n=1 Tax=Setaria digitata TaxID=48799 RepID=A0A915Q6U8_9BILA